MATTFFILVGILRDGAETAEGIQNQLVGLGGLEPLAAGTAVEAGLAVKKTRKHYVSRLPSKPSATRAWGAKASLLLRKRPSEISAGG